MNESSGRVVPDLTGTLALHPSLLPVEASPRTRSPPRVVPTVKNCWYHYYSYGSERAIRVPRDIDFSLASFKVTPDFARHLYDSEICHWQIGKAVSPGRSIVVLKTSVGSARARLAFLSTRPYVVGFFRVESVRDGIIRMHSEESLLLLSDPIEITPVLAKVLFPKKRKDYWEDPTTTFAAKVGSTTRNRYIQASHAEQLVNELVRRYNNGAKNYLGSPYLELLRRREPPRLENWFRQVPQP